MKINSISHADQVEVSHNPSIKKNVLVANGEIDHISNFSRAVFPPNEVAYSHSHGDMTEVFYIESGWGLITVNENSYPLSKGMCVTVEPTETHELKNVGSTDLVVLYFGVVT